MIFLVTNFSGSAGAESLMETWKTVIYVFLGLFLSTIEAQVEATVTDKHRLIVPLLWTKMQAGYFAAGALMGLKGA